MEDGEVFDTSLLKDTVNNLIASGKRNFALNLSPLDYIYSDSINVFMALNKRALDVSGRMSLLAPQPEVLQILKKAGVNNILRIFDSETDLIKTSEDIILQTTSLQLGDLQAIAQKMEPQSEFDQLRSEIGSVFGGDHQGSVTPQPPKTRPVSIPPVAPSIEQEFNDAFRQLEPDPYQSTGNYTPAPPPPQTRGFTPPQTRSFAPPPQTGGFVPPPPQTGGFVPPPPQTGGFFVPPPPQTGGFVPPQQYQARQYTPQPPAPPSRPMPPPQNPAFEQVPRQTSSYAQPEQPNTRFAAHNETQKISPVAPWQPQAQKQEPAFYNEEDFQAKPTKLVAREDAFDENDGEFDEHKKKSSAPILIVAVLIIALGAIGAYFGISKMSKKPATMATPPVVVQPPVQPVVPQVPVETPPIALEPDPIEIVKTVPPKKTEPKVVERKTPARKPASPTQHAVTPPPPAVQVNRVTITSVPAGCNVMINGESKGVTPLNWSDPIFGPSTIVVSKDGYDDLERSIEFTGGIMKQSFTLKRTPPPPVVRAQPEPVRPPPVYEPEPEPAPVPEPEPVRPPPVQQVATPVGGDASIFIASIPPVADVYLNGKLIGKTNVSEIKLPVGTHNLRFVKGAKETSKAITVQAGKNPSQMVRLP